MLPKWCSAVRPGSVGRRRGRRWQGDPRSCLLSMRRCTRSVGITPLLIGCSATDRVHRDVTGAASLVRSRGEHVGAVWLRPMLPVGVCGEGVPAVALVM